jgi:hypothetical protein
MFILKRRLRRARHTPPTAGKLIAVQRQLRTCRRVKSAKQQEELFDYGEKMFRDGIGCVRISLWNYGALKRRHRYG